MILGKYPPQQYLRPFWVTIRSPEALRNDLRSHLGVGIPSSRYIITPLHNPLYLNFVGTLSVAVNPHPKHKNLNPKPYTRNPNNTPWFRFRALAFMATESGIASSER